MRYIVRVKIMTDKIPIGQYKLVRYSEDGDHYVKIRLRKGIIVKLDDIITLDMIEPYESEAVRKVAQYLNKMGYCPENYMDLAKEIVKLVHEAEDADE